MSAIKGASVSSSKQTERGAGRRRPPGALPGLGACGLIANTTGPLGIESGGKERRSLSNCFQKQLKKIRFSETGICPSQAPPGQAKVQGILGFLQGGSATDDR